VRSRTALGYLPDVGVLWVYAVVMSTRIDTDSDVNTGHVIAAWLIALLTIGYMLPWAIAATRGKSNALAIALLNLFVGWTMVGWIVALVMACGSHQVVGRTELAATPAPTMWMDSSSGHTLTMNPVTGQPMRIDPASGQPWVEPAI
jgi:hypothetical protein